MFSTAELFISNEDKSFSKKGGQMWIVVETCRQVPPINLKFRIHQENGLTGSKKVGSQFFSQTCFFFFKSTFGCLFKFFFNSTFWGKTCEDPRNVQEKPRFEEINQLFILSCGESWNYQIVPAKVSSQEMRLSHASWVPPISRVWFPAN